MAAGPSHAVTDQSLEKREHAGLVQGFSNPFQLAWLDHSAVCHLKNLFSACLFSLPRLADCLVTFICINGLSNLFSFFLSVFLSFFLSFCLSVFLSFCLSVTLSLCLSSAFTCLELIRWLNFLFSDLTHRLIASTYFCYSKPKHFHDAIPNIFVVVVFLNGVCGFCELFAARPIFARNCCHLPVYVLQRRDQNSFAWCRCRPSRLCSQHIATYRRPPRNTTSLLQQTHTKWESASHVVLGPGN